MWDLKIGTKEYLKLLDELLESDTNPKIIELKELMTSQNRYIEQHKHRVGGQFKKRQERNEIKENTHFTKTYIHA